MLVQIALLAYIFLGESIDAQDMAGTALVVTGMLMVQVRRAKRQA